MADEPKPVITDDGNQRLSVIEDLRERDPKDYPKLTIEHLMHQSVETPTDARIDREIDTVLSRQVRARAVGGGMFKAFLSNPVLLYELYLLGERGWVAKMKETMRPDSLASGLTDAELGLAWEIFAFNVRRVAEKGAQWQKRRT